MAKGKNNEGECVTVHNKGGAFGGGVYGLAFFGALIYYLDKADSFWIGVLGILKAIVWPAMLIYKAFTLLNM